MAHNQQRLGGQRESMSVEWKDAREGAVLHLRLDDDAPAEGVEGRADVERVEYARDVQEEGLLREVPPGAESGRCRPGVSIRLHVRRPSWWEARDSEAHLRPKPKARVAGSLTFSFADPSGFKNRSGRKASGLG